MHTSDRSEITMSKSAEYLGVSLQVFSNAVRRTNFYNQGRKQPDWDARRGSPYLFPFNLIDGVMTLMFNGFSLQAALRSISEAETITDTRVVFRCR